MRSNTSSVLLGVLVIFVAGGLMLFGLSSILNSASVPQPRFEPMELNIGWDPALNWIAILNFEESISHNCKLSPAEVIQTNFQDVVGPDGPLNLPYEAEFRFTVDGNPALAVYKLDGVINFWDEPVIHSEFRSCSVNGIVR